MRFSLLFIEETAQARIAFIDLQRPKDIIPFLEPIQSDATRYLIFDDGEWSYVIVNCKLEIPESQISAVSRSARCDAVVIWTLELDRRIYLYRRGKQVRQIQSVEDGKWCYDEFGARQAFEDPAERSIRRIRDRLKVGVLEKYCEAITKRQMPDWGELAKKNVYGLKVEYPFCEDPPISYKTVHDLTIG